ncbi:MAG: BON domain-containing protein, partial [Nitrospirales bacterium]
PPTKARNLRKALWNTLRDVEMLPKDTLHVHAKDGVVTLSGLVETATQKAAAGKAAHSVPGVKKVINIIHVGTLTIQTEQD